MLQLPSIHKKEKYTRKIQALGLRVMNVVSLKCNHFIWNVLFFEYRQLNCSNIYLSNYWGSFLQMSKLSHYIHDWLLHISLLQCLWWHRPAFIFVVLTGKLNNFLSWNAYIFLGCVNNLLHIYCSLSNMQKENNYMCSLQVMLIQAGF